MRILTGSARSLSNIMDINYQAERTDKGGRFRVTISVSNFVPKPHTPFQWAAQDTPEMFRDKHVYLTKNSKIKGVTFNYHETNTSNLEAVFARGDRRVGRVLEAAHRLGCRFDGWSRAFQSRAVAEGFRGDRHRSRFLLLQGEKL